MRTLSKSEYKTYKIISSMRQPALLRTVENFLTDLYNEERVIPHDKFVYAVGDIPVMLVAHLDTVHTFPPEEYFYDKEKNVMWSPQGLGADDRAGVYAILKILTGGLRPHVLFTTDEEIGGIGANVAATLLEKPLVNFVIELDRRGEDDSVYYGCDNKEFENYINAFGFKTSVGSFSDISKICPPWGIAGVNLSIGYDNEHTKAEYLNVGHMLSTIEKVKKILTTVDYEKDKFEYIPKIYKYGGYNSYYGFGRDLAYDDADILGRDDLGEICYNCFNTVYQAMIVKTPDGGQYCGDCYPKLYTTCTKCKKSFKDSTKTETECATCKATKE